MALGSLLVSAVVAFLGKYFLTPKLIIFLEKIGMTGTDQQKPTKPKVAEMAGPSILFGFLGGTFLFLWLRIFLFGGFPQLIEVLAAISTITVITLVGMFDDLSALIKARAKEFTGNEKRIGLKQWQKPLLTLLAAVPLMATMSGTTTLAVPILGEINFGIFYPLFLVPIGIVSASNATNMLAGINGMEAGMGIVMLSGLGTYAWLFGATHASIIAFAMAAALLAFSKFNWCPAKIFPGDSATYMIGAAAAVVAIIGNMEKFALFCFAPWFIEFFLKLRSRFKANSFGILQNDGSLKSPYTKIYSLTHFVMSRGRFTEKQIASIMIAVEIIIVALGISIFYFGGFDGLKFILP